MCARAGIQRLLPVLHTAPASSFAHSACIQSCTQAPAPRLAYSTCTQECTEHLHLVLHTSTCIQACIQHLHPGLHRAPTSRLAHSTCIYSRLANSTVVSWSYMAWLFRSGASTTPASRLVYSTCTQDCTQHLHRGLHTAPASRLASSTVVSWSDMAWLFRSGAPPPMLHWQSWVREVNVVSYKHVPSTKYF